MTDVEIRRVQVKSLRETRRNLRVLLTELKKLDRTLDRLIAAKRVIRADTMGKLSQSWDKVLNMMTSSERATADAIQTVTLV